MNEISDLAHFKPCGYDPGLKTAQLTTSLDFPLSLWINPCLSFFYPQACALTWLKSIDALFLTGDTLSRV